jgi:hypothetical protein
MTHPSPRRRWLGLAAAAGLATLGTAGALTTGTAAADPAPPVKAPSAPRASVNGNALQITGSDAPDRIVVTFPDADPTGVLVTSTDGTTQRFDRTFATVVARLGNGDDSFTEAPSAADLPVFVQGGAGNDTIKGGNANDVLEGGAGNDTITGGTGDDLIKAGAGNDVVAGGVGRDTALLGGGNDTFTWLPGEGSDIVDGGAGHDVLGFAGAGLPERMSLSAFGTGAVLSRDLGNVRMDLDRVEDVQVQAGGGADAIDVGDLTGTDVRDVDLDLSSLGQPDGADDVVTVHGTAGNDNVRVSAHGRTVDVTGVTPHTHVTGSDPADELHVATGEGNDRVRVDDAAAQQLKVTSDLGQGQH